MPLLFWLGIAVADAASLNIAAAANLQPVLGRLATVFYQESGIELRPSFGSSGKFYAQIRQGAPFHLFMSADMVYPEKLHGEGLALAPPRIYGYGSLVLWSHAPRDLTDWQKVVSSSAIRHVAMADPDLAPYGREAMRLLIRFNLEATIRPKLVLGESIAQTSQFIATGAAEVGFTARSMMMVAPTGKMPGNWVEMPREAYDPIAQGVVLLRYAADHNREAANRFLMFLLASEARAIFQEYGYTPP